MASETSTSESTLNSDILKSVEEQLQEFENPTPSAKVTIKSERPATPVADIKNSEPDQQKESSSSNSVNTVEVAKDSQSKTASACVIKQEPQQDLQQSTQLPENQEPRNSNGKDQPVTESKSQNEKTSPPVSKEHENKLTPSKRSSPHVDARTSDTTKVSAIEVSKIKIESIEPSIDNIPGKSQENCSKVSDDVPKGAGSNEEKSQSEVSNFSKEKENSSAPVKNSSITAEPVKIKSESESANQKQPSDQQLSNKAESAKPPNECITSKATTDELSKTVCDLNVSNESALPANSSENTLLNKEKLSDSESIKLEQNANQKKLPTTPSVEMSNCEKMDCTETSPVNNEKRTIVDKNNISPSKDTLETPCKEVTLNCQLPVERTTTAVKVETADSGTRERPDDVLMKELGDDFELKSNEEKMEELRKYIPFLERWVKKLKETNSNRINNQLVKIETLLAVLANRRKSHDAASIAKFKAAIINLQKAASVQIPKPRSIKTEKIDTDYDLVSKRTSNVSKDACQAIQMSIQTISLDSDSEDDITFRTVEPDTSKNSSTTSTTEIVKKEPVPMEVDGIIDLSDDEPLDFETVSTNVEEKSKPNETEKRTVPDTTEPLDISIDKENTDASIVPGESSCNNVNGMSISDNVDCSMNNSDNGNKTVKHSVDTLENSTPSNAEVEKERIITQLQQKILSLTSNAQPKVPEADEEMTPIVKTEITWPVLNEDNMPLCIDLLDSDSDDGDSKGSGSRSQKTIDLEKLAEKPAEELIPIWLKMAKECGIKPSIATDLWGGNACINLADDDDDDNVSEASQNDTHFDDSGPVDNLADDVPSTPIAEGTHNESRKSASPSFSPPPQTPAPVKMTFDSAIPTNNQNIPMVTMPQDPRSSYNTKPISSFNNLRRSVPMVSVPKSSENSANTNNSFNNMPFNYDSPNSNLTNSSTPKDPRLSAENSRCYGSNPPTTTIRPAPSTMQPIPSIPMQPVHSMPVKGMPIPTVSSTPMQPFHRMPIQPMPMQQNPFDQLRMNNTPAYNPPQRNYGYNNYSGPTGNNLNKPNYRPNPFKTQPQWNSQNYSNYNMDRKAPSNSFERNRPSVSFTAAPYNYGAREEKKERIENIREPPTPTPAPAKPAYDSIIDKAYRSNDFDAAIKSPAGFKIPKKSYTGLDDLPAAARIRNEFKTEFFKLGRGKNDKKGKLSNSIDPNQEITPECEIIPSAVPIHDGKKTKEKKPKKKPQKKGAKNSLESKKTTTTAKRKIESDSESSSDDYTFSMDKPSAPAVSSSESSDEVEKIASKKGRKLKSKKALATIAETFKMFPESVDILPKLQAFCMFTKLLSGDKLEVFQKFIQSTVQSTDAKVEPAKKRKKSKPAQTKTEAPAKKIAHMSKELDYSHKYVDTRSSPDDILDTGSDNVRYDFQNQITKDSCTPSEPIYFRQIAKKRWKRMKTNDSVVGYTYTPKPVDDDSDLTDYYYDFPSKRVFIQKKVKAQFRYSLEPVLCISRCDGAGDPTPLLVPLKEIPFNDDAKRNKKKSWMKNTDRSRHCRSSYVDKCVICKKPKDDIVSHYVNQHKNTEVFISRLSQKDLNDIAKRPNEFSQAKTYEAKCVFCRDIQSFNLKFWHQHLSEHTGEFAYQCNACDLLAPKKPPLIYHTKNECDADARVHKIYHFDVQSGKISLYACVHCNYVQLYKENIMQHLKTEHENNKPTETDCREIIVFKVTNPNKSKAPTQSNENSRMDIDEESVASARDALGIDDGGDISTSDFEDGNEPVQVKVEISSERTNNNTTEPSTTEATEPPSLPEVTEEITTEDAVVVKQEPSEVLPIVQPQPTVIKTENAMEIDEECSMRNSIVFDQNTASREDTEQLYQPSEIPMVQAVPVATSSAETSSVRDKNTAQNKNANDGNDTESVDVKPFATNFNALPKMEMCLKPWAMHSYNTVYKKNTNLCKELEKSSNICALYKCSKKDCIFTTDSDVLFRDHVSTHGYIFLECPYCDTKVPTNIAELIVHIEEHKTDFFQCSNCFYRSCSAYNVYLHQNMYHFQDADRKIYICLAHSTHSTGSLGMTRGECISRIDDILTNRGVNVPPAKCRLCSQSYYLKSSLLSHVKAAHKIDVTDEIFNAVGVFVCLYCGYETDYIWNIRRHLMQHHPQKLTIVTARLQNMCPQLKGVVQQNVLSSTMLINVAEGVAEKLISLPPKTTFVDPDYEKMEKNLRLAINSLDIRKNYKLSKLFAENYSECFMNFDGTDVGLKDNLTVYKRTLGEDSKTKSQKNFVDLYLFINPILATRGYESADLYYCCDTPHASAETYFTHLQTKAHNKGLMIKCNQCTGCYDIAFLRNHILFHRKQRYICFACGFVCATADGIQTHFTTIHRKIKGKLRCIVISVLHIYETFLNDEDENDNEYYYVVNCESTKLSRQKFTEYIVELFERHYEGSLLSNPLTGTMITIFPNSVKIPAFVSHEIRYACSICGLSQNNFDELETHLRQEHLALAENYSCHHCKAKLPMYDSCYYRIKRHIELHGISIFQCNVCRYFHYDREIMLHHCKYFHTSNNIAIFSHVRRGKDSVKEEFEIVQNNLLGVTNNSSLRQNFECPACKEFNVEDFTSFSNHLKSKHNTALIYKCGYCETRGSEENTINNHLKSKHPSKSRDVKILFNSPVQASGSGTTTVQENPQKKNKSTGKLRLVSLDKLMK